MSSHSCWELVQLQARQTWISQTSVPACYKKERNANCCEESDKIHSCSAWFRKWVSNCWLNSTAAPSSASHYHFMKDDYVFFVIASHSPSAINHPWTPREATNGCQTGEHISLHILWPIVPPNLPSLSLRPVGGSPSHCLWHIYEPLSQL